MKDALHISARPLRRMLAGAVDIVLPPLCLRCRAVVETPGAVCPHCWPKLRFIAPPLCAACGFPFEYEIDAGVLCGNCLRSEPDFDRARAALVYDDDSRGLLLAFKHGDKTALAAGLAKWMVQAGAELLRDADAIVPVPLHWRRRIARRYNQSALLARRIARIGGVPHRPGLLVRSRATPTQGHLSAEQRRRNVAGAFSVPDRARVAIAGRRILLVDDVYTTGATLEACARTLRRAGAASVDALVLARVVRGALD